MEFDFIKNMVVFLIAIFFIHVRMGGNFYIKPRESPRCVQAAELVSSIGEVTELVERARLEIECASKGYRGFESPPLRLTNAFGEKHRHYRIRAIFTYRFGTVSRRML